MGVSATGMSRPGQSRHEILVRGEVMIVTTCVCSSSERSTKRGVRPSVLSKIEATMEALIAVVAIFLMCTPLFSQGNAGRILGVVTDQQGGAVSGATITITDTQQATSRTLKADDAGEVNAPNLVPGTYSK